MLPLPRNRLRVAALALLWLLLPVSLRAATPVSPPASLGQGRAERGVGFVAGPIGGVGFGYRWFDESGWGWQFGGLASHDSGETDAILGGQRMKTLSVHPKSRLYALAGASIDYTRRHDEATWVWGPPGYRRTETTVDVGAGIGVSFGKSDGLLLALELPLVLEFRSGLKSVGPIPQLSLVYNF